MITSFSSRHGLLQAVIPDSRLRCVNIKTRHRPDVQLIVGEHVVGSIPISGRLTKKFRAELAAYWFGQTERE
jgi:hypothetical protein